ncbi:MAG: hypothetical protein ABIO70_31750 [Pseudomonadota bacterium]
MTEKLVIAMEAPVAVGAALGLMLLWERAPARVRAALPRGSWRLMIACSLALLAWNAARALVGGPLRWRGTFNVQCSLGEEDDTYPYLWTNYVPLRSAWRRTAAYRRVGFAGCSWPLDRVQTFDVLPGLVSLWQRPLYGQRRRACADVVMLPRTADFEALELPRARAADTWIVVPRCARIPMITTAPGEVEMDLSDLPERGILLLVMADRQRTLADPEIPATPGIRRLARASWPEVFGEHAAHSWYAFRVMARDEGRGQVPLRFTPSRPPGEEEPAPAVHWARQPPGQWDLPNPPLIGGRELLEACFVPTP